MLRRIIRVVPKAESSFHPSGRSLFLFLQIRERSTIPRALTPLISDNHLRPVFYRFSSQFPHPKLSSAFHSTPSNHGFPLVALLASLLKASTGFEIARTASRIALTFIPFLWFHNARAKKMMKYAAIHGIATTEEQKEKHLKMMRKGTILLRLLLFVPFVLFWATIVASLERTPLTGRWRMILLSPEEEDEIASRLAGVGWYNSVGEILAEEGSPATIPLSDWRYQWVYNTLRQLESIVPILSKEPELCPDWIEGGPDCQPLPPPAEYPLRPRPRASEYIRWMCNKLTREKPEPYLTLPHAPGIPYSLLLIDKPESSNAFSYGFGPDGGSGIVVYSGFLDEIFSKLPPQYKSPPPQPKSYWYTLFGSLFSSPRPPPHPTPTREQTTELAILLAHEMAHLMLSHHLESLSGPNIIVPGTLSIMSDFIRVLIFPITMLFGPFVNDAVAQLGKVGTGELLKISEACNSTKQEIEADVVSARILAHAGFDARVAVKFWEEKSALTDGKECGRPGKSGPEVISPMKYARQIWGDSHPISEWRVTVLKQELARWEVERQKAIARQQRSQQEENRS